MIRKTQCATTQYAIVCLVVIFVVLLGISIANLFVALD